MAKNDLQQNEYTWDSGTYQTGATKENKRQSGVITVLLIAVIFLGGLASVLGLMNIRLVSKLMQQRDPVLPLSVNSAEGGENFFNIDRGQTPQVPQERVLELVLGTTSDVLPANGLTMEDVPFLATVTTQTVHGQLMTGGALVISRDGYLLVNAHLVEQSSSITVQLQDGRIFRAALVATDFYSDLSVLYIRAEDLPAAVFAGAEDQSLSLQALVNGESLSTGVMGENTRTLEVGQQRISLRETDFDTDHGPVFNGFGQVEGFLCRYFGSEDRGMLLSAAQVMQIARELVEQGAVSGRPGLDLKAQTLSAFCRQYWNLTYGLEIVSLESGGAAEAAGLLEGDILLSLQGQPLTQLQQLYEALLLAKPGQELTVEVFRAGQQLTLTVAVSRAG